METNPKEYQKEEYRVELLVTQDELEELEHRVKIGLLSRQRRLLGHYDNSRRTIINTHSDGQSRIDMQPGDEVVFGDVTYEVMKNRWIAGGPKRVVVKPVRGTSTPKKARVSLAEKLKRATRIDEIINARRIKQGYPPLSNSDNK